MSSPSGRAGVSGIRGRTRLEKVDSLLNPSNIVILGATDRPANWAQRIHRNLLRYGFAGNLYPINPKRDAIWDTKCYRSLDDLPEAPDHLLMLSPAPTIPKDLKRAAELGARSATIISAGFAEATGEEARRLTEELVAVIEETGLAISGPNCVGNINAGARVMTNFEDRHARIERGPVAIVSQSGGVGMMTKRILEERSIDVGLMVTSGSELGLTVGDYIEYYAHHPDTRVIVCYLEGLRDAARFLEACQIALAAGKPVIAVKLGASEEGRASAVVHTGSVSGSIEAFDAVAGRAGVIRVRNLDELVELTEMFVYAKPVEGGRIAGMTTSGGKRGMLIDAIALAGLKFADLDPSTVERLNGLLGVGSDVDNPLDAGFAASVSQDVYLTCVQSMVDDPNVDVLLLEGELPRVEGSARREGYMKCVNEIAERSNKPIVYFSVASYSITDYTRNLRRNLPNLPYLQGQDRAAAAIRAAIDYAGRKGARLPVAKLTPHQGELHRLLDQVDGTVADEVISKAILRLYGIPVPRESVARNEDEAAALAASLGFPVVFKVVSPDLPHKSDVGGVVLGIADEAAARRTYREMMDRMAALDGKPRIDGVLISEQIQGGVEVVVSANLDPEMGPLVLFGSGGIDVEIHKDFALSGTPLTANDARALIQKTRASVRLDAFRGRAALDKEAVVTALTAIGDLMVDAQGRVQSVEINPFVVMSDGGRALDGLVVLSNTEDQSQ